MYKLPVSTTSTHWFIRYKLYHLPFWLVYHILLWWLMTSSLTVVFGNIFSPYVIKFLFYLVFQALAVYLNLYVLIPRYLEKDRYVAYVSLVLLTIFITALIIVPGYYFGAWAVGKTFTEMYNRDPADYLFFFQVNTLPSTAASMTLAMSVKLTRNWMQARRRERLLEKEKLETELKFLKSQFNPHFLFNTINSIFVLIHKNPQMASESLAKFSDLLRYQLYECNEQQIPLHQELGYLENFIELEKLRQERNIELTLHVQEPPANDLTIAPFVLMPFVENAFKHVSKEKDQPNRIQLQLQFEGDTLCMDVSNSIAEATHHTADPVNYGGIGLKNVQRRLELLYPGAHELIIQRTHTQFNVHLRLHLAEYAVRLQPMMVNTITALQ